ncbi:MAG TPA: EAL domain-containing protein [Candidatus Binatia bacterium]
MTKSIRALLVEHSDDDVQVLVREMRQGGYDLDYLRVETPTALASALSQKTWDVVLAEYRMPAFNGTDALRLYKRAGLDCPFVIISGAMSDETGAATMKAGAHDYLLKENLTRLVPTIERELQQAEIRRQYNCANQKLQHLARHDLITDLPNYTFFAERLAQILLNAQRERNQLAVLIMKVNRFHDLNEALGDQLCDVLLMQLARRLTEELPSSLTFTCLRSSEFGVLVPAAKDSETAVQVVHEIISVLERPFIISEGLKLDLQVGFGIALFPEHGTTADLLIRRARAAFATAKKNHSPYAFYTLEHQQSAQHRLSLVGDLRRAIVENQLFLLYQPKVDLDSLRLTGVEALVRWKHPQLGILTPDHFIPLAEQTGLIMPLTLWVLNEALRQSRIWQQENVDLSIAVNLSPWNLQSSRLSEQIGGLLSSSGIPPSRLELELTESAIVANPRQAAEILAGVKQMGLLITVDDFGTGYSSLAHLHRLPIDAIKIDQSFVMKMATETQDAVIVRSMIHLAHNLNLKVIAEGVENRQTMDMLRTMGCDMAQGYYISHPRPPQELPRRLLGWRDSGF